MTERLNYIVLKLYMNPQFSYGNFYMREMRNRFYANVNLRTP